MVEDPRRLLKAEADPSCTAPRQTATTTERHRPYTGSPIFTIWKRCEYGKTLSRPKDRRTREAQAQTPRLEFIKRMAGTRRKIVAAAFEPVVSSTS